MEAEIKKGDYFIQKQSKNKIQILEYDPNKEIFIVSLDGKTHPNVDGNIPWITKEDLLKDYEKMTNE